MSWTIMKKILLLSILLFCTLPTFADFAKGSKAYWKSDYATALKEWEPLAEQGNVEAQFFLGKVYDHAKSEIQNYKTAAKYYTLAAE